MNARRCVGLSLALAALACLVVPAFAQDTAKLVWTGFKEKKDDKGKVTYDKFYQEMATATTQEMTVMQMKITQEQSQTFLVSWEPISKDAKGNWTVKQRIEGIVMDITIGGNKISFDSKQDPAKTPNNPLTDFFKTLKEAEFTLTIAPDLTVTDVKDRKEFIKKLAAANPQLEPLLNAILSDKALKGMFEQSFAVLPPEKDAAVKKGSTWSKKDVKLDLGPIGVYTNNYTYTFDGVEKKKEGGEVRNLAKILVDTDVKYSAPSQDAKQVQLPFKIVKASLESKPYKDEKNPNAIYYDLDNGRIDSSSVKLKLEGTLDIEIGGMTTNVRLEQTQTATLKTYPTIPPNWQGKTK